MFRSGDGYGEAEAERGGGDVDGVDSDDGDEDGNGDGDDGDGDDDEVRPKKGREWPICHIVRKSTGEPPDDGMMGIQIWTWVRLG